MLFELPFDLIVVARTLPPVPPHPQLYRAVLFLPLLRLDVTTLALPSWPPAFPVNRAAPVCLGLTFTVFAAWALIGFAYPSAPLPIAASVASKLLAFAVAASLLMPTQTPAPPGASGSAPPDRPPVPGGLLTPHMRGFHRTHTALAQQAASAASATGRRNGGFLDEKTRRPQAAEKGAARLGFRTCASGGAPWLRSESWSAWFEDSAPRPSTWSAAPVRALLGLGVPGWVDAEDG